MADFLTPFFHNLVSGVQNLPHNMYNSLASASNMTAIQWIRIIMVVGGYLLLRPFLLKWAGQAQEKNLDKMMDKDERQKKAKISPNALRGVQVPEDTDEEEDEEEDGAGAGAGDASGANWGKKARKRQRRFVRKVLEEEEEERRRQLGVDSDEDEKEVEEFLERYTSMRTQLEEE